MASASYEAIKALREQDGLGWKEIGERLDAHPEQIRATYNRAKSKETADHQAALREAIAIERASMITNRDKGEDRWVLRTKVMTEALIKAAEQSMPRIKPAELRPLRPIVLEGQPQTAFAVVSDAHIGAHVDLEETGGFGSYSYEKFRERLNNYRDAILNITALQRLASPVPRLVAPLLGDLIENIEIFPAQGEMVDLDLIDQFSYAVRDFAQFYLDLAQDFDHIFVPVVVGNHGRIGRKGQHKSHINWDYAIGRMLQQQFDQAGLRERVQVVVPKAAFMVIDIEGFSFLLRHGHGIKAWGGIPFYGLQRSVSRWIQVQAAVGNYFDYMVVGHFHQAGSLPWTGGETIMNGSFVGTTEFSVEVIEGLAEPSQFLGFVHPQYGLAARYPILLDRIHRRKALELAA